MTLQALLQSKANSSSERSINYTPNEQWRLSQILLSSQSLSEPFWILRSQECGST